MMFDQLPEPERPRLSKEERRVQAQQFAIVLNYFILGYNVVHKLVMPLYVQWTAKTTTGSHHYLDWWWLFHLVLVFVLRRKNWDDILLRALVYFGFGGVFLEVLISFNEFSWHIVSFWVTSAASLGLLFYLLAKSKYSMPTKSHLFFMVGVFIFGAIFQYFLVGQKLKLIPEAKHFLKKKAEISYPALENVEACGLEGFSLPGSRNVNQIFETLSHGHVLTAKDCGLWPALAIFDQDQDFVLQNNTDGYLNIKLLHLDDFQIWRGFRNIPMRKGETYHLKKEEFSHDIVLIRSDSRRDVGISLFLSVKGIEKWLKHFEKVSGQDSHVSISRETVSIFPNH